jgi:hypothetical protein
MYAFEQEIGGDECAFVFEIEDGCIVTNTFLCGSLEVLNIFREVSD